MQWGCRSSYPFGCNRPWAGVVAEAGRTHTPGHRQDQHRSPHAIPSPFGVGAIFWSTVRACRSSPCARWHPPPRSCPLHPRQGVRWASAVFAVARRVGAASASVCRSPPWSAAARPGVLRARSHAHVAAEAAELRALRRAKASYPLAALASRRCSDHRRTRARTVHLSGRDCSLGCPGREA